MSSRVCRLSFQRLRLTPCALPRPAPVPTAATAQALEDENIAMLISDVLVTQGPRAHTHMVVKRLRKFCGVTKGTLRRTKARQARNPRHNPYTRPPFTTVA